MVGFEKALRAVKVIKDQIQYSLLNLAPGHFSTSAGFVIFENSFISPTDLIHLLANSFVTGDKDHDESDETALEPEEQFDGGTD